MIVTHSRVLCDSFDCELQKSSQLAIIRISQSKPDLWYIKYWWLLIWYKQAFQKILADLEEIRFLVVAKCFMYQRQISHQNFLSFNFCGYITVISSLEFSILGSSMMETHPLQLSPWKHDSQHC